MLGEIISFILIFCVLFTPIHAFALQSTTMAKLEKTWDLETMDYRRIQLLEKANTLVGYTTYGHAAGSNKIATIGNKPKQLCCSSFVAWAYYYSGLITDLKSNGKAKIDVNCDSIPKTTYFESVSESEILPGDLAWAPGQHIGIYAGTTESGVKMYIHCSGNSGRNGVVIDHDSRFTKFFRYKKFKDDNSNSIYAKVSSSEPIKAFKQFISKYISSGKSITAEDMQKWMEGYNGDVDCSGKTGILGDPNDENSVAWLLQQILNYIKVLGPLLVIVLSAIDFIKVIIQSDDESMAKAQKKLIIRLLLAAALFFIPTLVTVLLNIFGITSDPLCGLS